jgi:hypothetical protein
MDRPVEQAMAPERTSRIPLTKSNWEVSGDHLGNAAAEECEHCRTSGLLLLADGNNLGRRIVNKSGRQVVPGAEGIRRPIGRSVPLWISSATENNSKENSNSAADCRGQHLTQRPQ